MGQKQNWKMFIETTKAKAEAHEKVAQYWNTVNTNLGLILILLSAVTTVLAAIKGTPKMVTVGVSGVTTLISAIAGENLNVRFERVVSIVEKKQPLQHFFQFVPDLNS